MTLTNRQAHDIAIAKQLYLERVKTELQLQAEKLLQAHLKALFASVYVEVSNADFANMSKGSLRAIIANFKRVEREQRAVFKDALVKLLREFASKELALQLAIWNDDETEDPAELTQEEQERSWTLAWGSILGTDGRTLEDFAEAFIVGIGLAYVSSIQSSKALAEPANEALGKLRGIGSPVKLATVVLTAVQTIAHSVFKETAGRLSPKYIWISVLDSRTSDICLGLSRKIFIVGQGPLPPAHPRCRSTTAPWRENGGPVPKVNLQQWLATQPKSELADLLSNKPLSTSEYIRKVKAYGTQSKNQ